MAAAERALREHRTRCALLALSRVPDHDGRTVWLKNALRFEIGQAAAKRPKAKEIGELVRELENHLVGEKAGAVAAERMSTLHFALRELMESVE